VIPPGGAAPDVKLGVADAAYLRASKEWKDRLYLPQKLPEKGQNPKVAILIVVLIFIIFFHSREMRCTRRM